MNKKMLSAMVTLFAAMVIPWCASAATAVVDGITWTYDVVEGKARIVNGNYSGEITVPESLGGRPVTIGMYAFWCCSGLTSVRIPPGVTSIGYKAFECCGGLQSIDVDDGNSNYSSLEGVLFNKDRTLLIHCPAGKQGEYRVPSSVKSIGEGAFSDCDWLTSVTIPSGATSIGSMAFSICARLQSIDVDDGNSNYSSLEGVLFNKDRTLLIRCPAGKQGEYRIPSSVKSIGDYAFSGCNGLTSVTIPSNVKSIGYFAFPDDAFERVDFNGAPPEGFGNCFDNKKAVVIRYNENYQEQWWIAIERYGYANAVPYRPPSPPSIAPASGTAFDATLTISISVEDGATIYYTVDGNEPMTKSATYSKKFRVDKKTVVKAFAVYKNGQCSEVAVAEYAKGFCDNPVISPTDGTVFFHSNQVVTIDWDETQGELRYTLDGSEPTERSMVYDAPFTISKKTTIKAKVFSDDYFDSQIVTAKLTRKWLTVENPSVMAEVEFVGAENEVSIECPTAGATIYYTLDGSNPTKSSEVYSGIFSVTNSCVVKAIAMCDDMLDSNITSFAITRNWLPIGDVSVSAEAAFVGASTPVTLSCATEGAEIYYTLDGSEPTAESTMYEGMFDLTNRCTVRALAVLSNEVYRGTSTANFAITRHWLPIDNVTVSAEAVFVGASTPVTISCSTEGAEIYYTLDGSEPTAESATYEGTFDVPNSCTVRAFAVLSNEVYRGTSTASFAIIRNWLPVAAPVISAAASFKGSKTPVEISCETEDATIYYTTDGSAPNENSPRYENAFNVTNSCVVRAWSVLSNEVYRGAVETSFSIEKIWTIGDALNVPDMVFTTSGDKNWVRDAETSHDGVEAMRSGGVADNQKTEIATTVEGAGILSCWLKVSCEDSGGYYDYDRLEFHADDDVLYFDGECDWTNVVYRFDSGGTHTLCWVYIKDNVEKDGDDCAWLDEICWTVGKPIEKGSVCEIMPDGLKTPLVVSNDWLIAKGLADDGDSVLDVAAKMSETGKNGIPRYQSYVLGMEPDSDVSAEEQLKVTISGFDKDGVPIIGYEPTPNDASHVTVKKLGVKTLGGDWEEVPIGKEVDYNFFKVTVEVR